MGVIIVAIITLIALLVFVIVTSTPEYRIQSYDDKLQHLADLESEAFKEIEKHLDTLGGQKMYVCNNKPLEQVVSCINDPELDKKIERILMTR